MEFGRPRNLEESGTPHNSIVSGKPCHSIQSGTSGNSIESGKPCNSIQSETPCNSIDSGTPGNSIESATPCKVLVNRGTPLNTTDPETHCNSIELGTPCSTVDIGTRCHPAEPGTPCTSVVLSRPCTSAESDASCTSIKEGGPSEHRVFTTELNNFFIAQDTVAEQFHLGVLKAPLAQDTAAPEQQHDIKSTPPSVQVTALPLDTKSTLPLVQDTSDKLREPSTHVEDREHLIPHPQDVIIIPSGISKLRIWKEMETTGFDSTLLSCDNVTLEGHKSSKNTPVDIMTASQKLELHMLDVETEVLEHNVTQLSLQREFNKIDNQLPLQEATSTDTAVAGITMETTSTLCATPAPQMNMTSSDLLQSKQPLKDSIISSPELFACVKDDLTNDVQKNNNLTNNDKLKTDLAYDTKMNNHLVNDAKLNNNFLANDVELNDDQLNDGCVSIDLANHVKLYNDLANVVKQKNHLANVVKQKNHLANARKLNKCPLKFNDIELTDDQTYDYELASDMKLNNNNLSHDVISEVMSFRLARRSASERDLRRTADHIRLYLYRLAELRVWFDERVRRVDISLQRIISSEERHNLFTVDDEIRFIRTMRMEREHGKHLNHHSNSEQSQTWSHHMYSHLIVAGRYAQLAWSVLASTEEDRLEWCGEGTTTDTMSRRLGNMTLSAARDNILLPLHKAALGAGITVLRACDQSRMRSCEATASHKKNDHEEVNKEDEKTYLTILSALCLMEERSTLANVKYITNSFYMLIDSLAPMWILPPSKRLFDQDEKRRDEHSEQSYTELLNESLPFVRRFLIPANQKLSLRANQPHQQRCPCSRRNACSPTTKTRTNQKVALSTNQKLCICLNQKYCLCADLKLCLCAKQDVTSSSSTSNNDVTHLEPSYLLEQLLNLVFSYVTERLQTESYEAHRFLSELITITTEVDRDPSWIELTPREQNELVKMSAKYDNPEATIQSVLIDAGEYVKRESANLCQQFGASCPCDSLLHVMVTPLASDYVTINCPVVV